MPLWRLLKLSLIGAPLLALLAVWLAPGQSTPTTVTSSAGVDLPDLVIDSISGRYQFGDCTTPAGVDVVVHNIGGRAAGASTTRVSAAGSGAQSVSTPALGAGEQVTLHTGVTGIPSGDTYTATADYLHVVAERNEDNNSLSGTLTVTTLPTCTPSRTPTPTPTPTATPSPAPTPGGLVGDANKDGIVNAVDAALVLQYSAGLITSFNPNADAHHDGQINAIDAAVILQYVAGLLHSL